MMTATFLGWTGFTYDATLLNPTSWTGRCFPILAGGASLFVFSSIVFLAPFTLGAYYLRFCFRNEERPARWITLGLLTAWAGEKASVILLSAWAYGMPLCPALLVRIYRGSDTTAPWMSPVYVVLPFAMCLALGRIFG